MQPLSSDYVILLRFLSWVLLKQISCHVCGFCLFFLLNCWQVVAARIQRHFKPTALLYECLYYALSDNAIVLLWVTFYYWSCYYTSPSVFLPKLQKSAQSIVFQMSVHWFLPFAIVLLSCLACILLTLCSLTYGTVLLYCVPLHDPAGTTFLSSVFKLYRWTTTKPIRLNNTCHQLVIALHIVRKDPRQWKTRSFLLFKKIIFSGKVC